MWLLLFSARDFMWLLIVLAPLACVPCRRGTMLVTMSQTPETGAKHSGLCVRAGWDVVASSGSQLCSLMLRLRTTLLYKQSYLAWKGLMNQAVLGPSSLASSSVCACRDWSWLRAVWCCCLTSVLATLARGRLPCAGMGIPKRAVGGQSFPALNLVGALSKQRQSLSGWWLGGHFESAATVQCNKLLCMLSEKQFFRLWTEYTLLGLKGTFRNARSVEKRFCNRCVVFIFFYSNLSIPKLVH